MIANTLDSAVLLTTPLLLAALGGLLNRLGGIINIGLEGKMLVGAFAGTITASAVGNPWVGLMAAALAGGVVAWLFSLTITRLGANMIIAGLGLNILLAGTVGFLLSSGLRESGALSLEAVTGLPQWDIPVVADVPVVGPLLSGNDPVTWAAWLLVPATVLVLRRSRWGLRVRATGADEPAARSFGIATMRTRDSSTVAAGVLAGVGGAHLPLGVVGLFDEGMIAGRGFIALAAFYFGRNRPWPTAGACLLFALFDAAQTRLQLRGFPTQLVQILPYLAVILVLAVAGIRAARSRTRQMVMTE